MIVSVPMFMLAIVLSRTTLALPAATPVALARVPVRMLALVLVGVSVLVAVSGALCGRHGVSRGSVVVGGGGPSPLWGRSIIRVQGLADPNLRSPPRPLPFAMSDAKSPQRFATLRIVTMPRDTNHYGTIFGGVILSYIDQAGAVEAARQTPHKIVTVAMDKVVFHQPVFVGDVVSFYTELLRVGRTSITVKVIVEAYRRSPGGAPIMVTEAQVVYVAIDDDLKPIPAR